MSRTKRYIDPYFKKELLGKSIIKNTWIGLGDYSWDVDKRSSLYFGYDGKQRSYIYSAFPPRGYREYYRNKSKRFYKQYFNKVKRQYIRMQILRELYDIYYNSYSKECFED